MTALEKALVAPRNLSVEEIAALLTSADDGLWREAFAAAWEIKTRCGKTEVLPRGLIECSNVCAKNCLYCGIRKGNGKAVRYQMPEDDVCACIDEARRRGYPAVAFQAGEIESEANTAYYERLLAYAKPLEVTLSLGEQTEEVYRRWKEAGAMRYLIRIETSNRELYAKIHPAECSYERRVECIRTLKRLGYVTGSGVMIGLPGQTIDDLACDIVFFGAENLDMVGMGPYIAHPDSQLPDSNYQLPTANYQLPTANCQLPTTNYQLPTTNCQLPTTNYQLALRMIALTRLYLWNVNIVAATALEALDPESGRNRGIEAGANVIMPNLTPEKYRANYDLYPGKTTALSSKLESTGETQ